MSRPKDAASSGSFGGGFFLPAQRSMHCKGGFFTSTNATGHPTTLPASTTTTRIKPIKPPPPIRHKGQPPQQVKNRRPMNQETHDDQPTLPLLDGNVHHKYEMAMQELHSIKGQLHTSLPVTTPAIHEPPPSAVEPELPSPEKKLQIAEAVIRKLYKKNLDLEKALAAAKDNAARRHDVSPASPPTSTLVHPPTVSTVEAIGTKKDEYLQFLAAEQDKTIRELRAKVDELLKARPETVEAKTNVIPRLQKRLQEAVDESKRQRTNYLRMKQSYDKLLLQRTRTLSSSADVDKQARAMLSLMEQRLAAVEGERDQEAMLFNMKLFETEKQNCDAYVAQKMLQDEISTVVDGVRERDAIDDQIDKCMLGVFERLHQVELENVQLRDRPSGPSGPTV